MEDMKVANIDYNYGFALGSSNADPHDSNSDWSKIQHICSFSHTEACEFIVWLGTGTDRELSRLSLKEFREIGMSEEFISECKAAAEAGFCYACFYA